MQRMRTILSKLTSRTSCCDPVAVPALILDIVLISDTVPIVSSVHLDEIKTISEIRTVSEIRTGDGRRAGRTSSLQSSVSSQTFVKEL